MESNQATRLYGGSDGFAGREELGFPKPAAVRGYFFAPLSEAQPAARGNWGASSARTAIAVPKLSLRANTRSFQAPEGSCT